MCWKITQCVIKKDWGWTMLSRSSGIRHPYRRVWQMLPEAQFLLVWLQPRQPKHSHTLSTGVSPGQQQENILNRQCQTFEKEYFVAWCRSPCARERRINLAALNTGMWSLLLLMSPVSICWLVARQIVCTYKGCHFGWPVYGVLFEGRWVLLCWGNLKSVEDARDGFNKVKGDARLESQVLYLF